MRGSIFGVGVVLLTFVAGALSVTIELSNSFSASSDVPNQRKCGSINQAITFYANSTQLDFRLTDPSFTVTGDAFFSTSASRLSPGAAARGVAV